MAMNNILKYIDDNRDKFVQQLCDWLKIPSVSTDSAFRDEVRRAAQWLHDRFEGMGLASEIIETVGHPIVYAETPPVPGGPVVLVYGHYDVQPPDPLDLWDSPPFEPAIRDGKVYARGATDDKGQLLTHVLSTEAWLATKGSLPVQIKFLVEGEEECGSRGLNEFLAGRYDSDISVNERLAADVAVISDMAQFAPGQPAITYGLRGISYFELRLTGPNRDLHSGAFGGSVMNPANAMCKILAALIDDHGRIQVPGFYDDVIPLSDQERKMFAELKFDDEQYSRELGVDQLFGEEGYLTLERRWARPSFDINGLWSGYQGEGAKTVLPSQAGAKFSFRLVPNQDVSKIAESLKKYLQEICPPGIHMQLIDRHGAPGFVLPLDSPYIKAAAKAIEQGFNTEPVFIRSGGSIPVVNTFSNQLGLASLLLGWGQDDDNPHSPNEKFSLDDFYHGTRSSAWLWPALAEVATKAET